jgi:hypothetical protein
VYVAMHLARSLLKLEDGASNMATRSQIAAWMDAVIEVLHTDFAKDTEPTITKSKFRYNMCQFHHFLTNESSTVTNKSITVSNQFHN